MKILYGVQGVGNGHLTRSRILIKALKQRGHEVQVIFSGRAEEKFRFVEDFIPYDVYRGLSFATSNGRVDHLKTLKEIRPIQFIKDLSTIKTKDIDLIFSDFEPLTSRAARKHHIPSIGIGHQYAFLYNIPKTKNLLAQFILKNYAPVDVGIGLHWHDYDSPILPPIISPVPSVNTLEQKILVYLPWESSHTISQALLSFTDYEFFIYHDIPRKKREKNLFWHPYAPTFLDDLASSSGVISNAGFELPSEALSAGKKLLVKPLKGQAEQEANALALKQLGLGMVSTDLSSQDISFWLDRSTSSKIPVMHDVQPLLEWIEKGNWSSIDSLKKQYWS